ncbi:MAG: phosphatase PAP2 family protein [Alphaproteobacteria bacterium]|nr:phosphatase PAP2 family protein [Alphaproteobacteria bacterium]
MQSTLLIILYFITSGFLLVGVYFVYYKIQISTLNRSREISPYLDDFIPFNVHWVWFYSGAYYLFFFLLIFLCPDHFWFTKIVFSFVILAVLHMAIYVIWPIKLPARWRDFDGDASLSARFLRFIQKTDALNNAFPSLHVGAATIIALHLDDILQFEDLVLRLAIFGFPVLVAVSASLTKQHYVADYPPAIMLACLSYALAAMLVSA